jgi:DNA-binding LacI/PurR family transcriptional regulator
MASRQPALGIITNDRHNIFQRNAIAGIEDIASQHGYRVVVDSFAEDPAHPGPITLDVAAMAGVLVIADAAPHDLLRQIDAMGVPMVLVSHQVPGLPIPSIIVDNAQGIAALIQHVVEHCGRRKLVFIQGLMSQRDAIERDAAFRWEQMRYNLAVPPSRFLRGEFIESVAADSVRALLETDRDFDAIVASDYVMAQVAVEVLREAGIRVPQDVCVVGFGDAPEAEAAGLTTVAADVGEQGRRAARQLLSAINGRRTRGVTVLSARLIVRQTC